ncbi:MAG TPA: hypothetical protein VKA07_10580 [Candidatus Sulfotelmatobacter sp.]|nr:hypothetical protein [Candidatus Sulfotelmatobacter sp.]
MANEQEKPELVVDVETLSRQFEELVDRVIEGQAVVIMRNDQPFAKLVPLQ